MVWTTAKLADSIAVFLTCSLSTGSFLPTNLVVLIEQSERAYVCPDNKFELNDL